VAVAQLGELAVVVVDDDPVMLRFLEAMVRGQGVAAVSAHTDPRAALAALTDPTLESGHPACVLLDINMPELDGIEFVRHLAEHGHAGGLVLVSGEDVAMRRATAMLAQARGLRLCGTLAKPPGREALRAALVACLPEARAGGTPAPGPSRRFGYADLQAALAGAELVNHYQPQVSPQTGAVIGVEALVRWQHPLHGLVPPAQFVPVAERYGLIGELLAQTLRRAFSDLAAWQGRGHHLRVAVNVSMDNLAVTGTADFIEGEARAAGVTRARSCSRSRRAA
jgi:CheY-like chemotaxis protein